MCFVLPCIVLHADGKWSNASVPIEAKQPICNQMPVKTIVDFDGTLPAVNCSFTAVYSSAQQSALLRGSPRVLRVSYPQVDLYYKSLGCSRNLARHCKC